MNDACALRMGVERVEAERDARVEELGELNNGGVGVDDDNSGAGFGGDIVSGQSSSR